MEKIDMENIQSLNKLLGDLDLNIDNKSMAVLNLLSVGVGIYEKDGTLLFINDNVYRIFGVDPELFRNKEINVFDDPELPKNMKDAIRNYAPLNIRFPYDFDKIPKNEHNRTSQHEGIKLIECHGQPIIGKNGQANSYAFIIEDVTEKIRNEEELRNSRCKIDMAMKVADIMFWEFDVNTKLFRSENEPLNGYDKTVPLTIQRYTETVHPDDRPQAEEIMRRMSSGENFSYTFDGRIFLYENLEWQYCAISGSPYEYDRHGKVIRYVGTRKNNTVLQKKKKLQEKILNNIPLSIHIKDVEDDSRYLFCNDESQKMFGTSEGKKVNDIMNREVAELLLKTDLEVFNTGVPYLGPEQITLKDGRNYETIVRKSVIEDNGKRLLLNVRWDQSLQNELQRRSKLLALTMETMNAYTWFYEPEKERISFDDGVRALGRDASEINTLDKFVQNIHPDDRKHFTQSLQETVVKESGKWQVEYRLDMNNDGVYQWWETRGVIETSTLNDKIHKYMFGMTICIEGHKQTELTLLRNKERLDHLVIQNELILNNTNSGLAYIRNDYIVQWENLSICSKSLSYEAYKQGELCYKSAHNRTSPCEDCVLERSMKSRQTEQIKFYLDSNHTMEIFATPVFGNDGAVDGIVIRVDDVTAQEKMIEELREAKEKAEESDKLKSAFLANMSHEIRTPLNAIVGFSAMLLDCSEEEKPEYMQIIHNNNELLLKLISDILDLSKIEAGFVELKYENFDLSEYFNGLVASMKQRIKSPSVQLIAKNPYQTCQVKLDPTRVAQILTNFVTNAIKYTPKGFIEMGYELRGEGIYLFVKDTGIGISDEKKGKVFHRFEKLDEFAQGTGLGLSICKAIVESMNGSINFESKAGEGSTFWAFLPCEVSPETKIEETNAPSRNTNLEKKTRIKTILIVEDIQSNYKLLLAMLSKNYTFVHATNGLEAIEIVRNGGIDLVLMDMKMPVMDGLKSTSEIRTFNKELPIIALTAHAYELDRIAAMSAGCSDYLVKPIDRATLLKVLRSY